MVNRHNQRFLYRPFIAGQNLSVSEEPDDLDQELASRIRGLMRDHKITGEKLAEKLGVTPAAVARWRKKGTITRPHIVALARLFNVSIDWLMTGQVQWGETPQRRAWIEQIEALSPQQLRRLQAISDALIVADDPSDYTGEPENNGTGTDC